MIRHALVSDLHLGAPNSVLSNVTECGVTSGTPDEVDDAGHPLNFVSGHTHKPFAAQVEVDGVDLLADVFDIGGRSTIADEIVQRRHQLCERIAVGTNRVSGAEPEVAPRAEALPR